MSSDLAVVKRFDSELPTMFFFLKLSFPTSDFASWVKSGYGHEKLGRHSRLYNNVKMMRSTPAFKCSLKTFLFPTAYYIANYTGQ